MPFINNIEETLVVLCRLYIVIMLLCKINCYYCFCLKVAFVPNTLSLQYWVIDTVYTNLLPSGRKEKNEY